MWIYVFVIHKDMTPVITMGLKLEQNNDYYAHDEHWKRVLHYIGGNQKHQPQDQPVVKLYWNTSRHIVDKWQTLIHLSISRSMKIY